MHGCVAFRNVDDNFLHVACPFSIMREGSVKDDIIVKYVNANFHNSRTFCRLE